MWESWMPGKVVDPGEMVDAGKVVAPERWLGQ